MSHLRDYQGKMSDAVIEEWKTVPSTLLVCPTGGGKTVVFADVIKRRGGRAMVIAHREELIWQAKDKIEKFADLRCEIEMAHLAVHPNLFGNVDVMISTVQTLNSGMGDRTRMSKFDPREFSTLVIDEGHHAPAATYKNVINYFSKNPDLRILGVTATPDRADEEALGQVFNTVAMDYEILDAIQDGWLVDVDQRFVTINGLDYSQIKTTCGDLNGAEMAAVLESESNLQAMASASVAEIGNRRTIVFAASVKQAEVMSDIFNRHRLGMSEWVCGATNKDQRRDMLSRFAQSRFQVVVNVGVLTEGFDDAGVECIVMARPTKSRSLYSQMIGRSTRPAPGIVDDPLIAEIAAARNIAAAEIRRDRIRTSVKPSCLVVDFVGNSGKHKLMSSADILGGNVSDDALNRAIARAKKMGKPVRMSELLVDSAKLIAQEAEQRRMADAARKHRLVATASYKSKVVNPFDVFDMQPAKPRGWDMKKTLSEKQTSMLLKQGINPDGLPYAHARQIIGEIFNRWNKNQCSFKQAALLKRFGYSGKMTREEAKRTIDALAKNGWRKPDMAA